MRTVSAACTLADAPSSVASVIVARRWRRTIFIMVSLAFLDWSGVERSGGAATCGSFGGGELDQMHGRHKVLRERGDRGIGIAFERSPDDRGVFGLDIPGLLVIAPDREPSIALALFVQHI